MATRNMIYVNASVDMEVRPPKGGRTYFFAQNNSAADVYYEEGTLATSENGIVIAAGQFIEQRASDGQSVPQGNLWFRGSAAAPTLQRITIKEG